MFLRKILRPKTRAPLFQWGRYNRPGHGKTQVELQALQRMTDHTYAIFLQRVAKARKLSLEAVNFDKFKTQKTMVSQVVL